MHTKECSSSGVADAHLAAKAVFLSSSFAVRIMQARADVVAFSSHAHVLTFCM